MTQTSFPLAAKTRPPAPRPAAVGPLGAGRDPQTSSSQGARGLKSGEEEEPEAGSLGRGERAGGGNAWGGGPRGGRGGPGPAGCACSPLPPSLPSSLRSCPSPTPHSTPPRALSGQGAAPRRGSRGGALFVLI